LGGTSQSHSDGRGGRQPRPSLWLRDVPHRQHPTVIPFAVLTGCQLAKAAIRIGEADHVNSSSGVWESRASKYRGWLGFHPLTTTQVAFLEPGTAD
jgi:hypothetical protein